MVDKKVVLILLLLAVYIFFTRPASSDFSTKVFELRQIERSIAKEKFIREEAKKIEKLYPKEMRNAEINKKLFFPKNISVPSAMSSMQKMIEAIARKNGLQIMNITWGAVENKKGYTVLPISFMIRGYPARVFSFVRDTLSMGKLIRFAMYFSSKSGNKLSVRATVLGFKIGNSGSGKGGT